ncbi:5-methylcytosine-specific restriction enzyme A [Clostridium neonatale]|uniref:HNH endonuclease n=1 Tax=Clostridium TaxID=1485 RepID=UPI0029094E72|nr:MULTISPECIES: HNH endonuclease signature motif containing protein [Clostridium]MDU4479717.1 HNH endonuclease signature motif containing protein [Clostridium sp.]CAI3641792.1 5-methylcytosine-specific restriction enzyme A [Clostridium neonatale]
MKLLREQKGLCEVCKAQGRLRAGNEVHHVVKVANGNNDTHYDLDNLIYVCTRCHRAIEGMNVEEVMKYISLHL